MKSYNSLLTRSFFFKPVKLLLFLAFLISLVGNNLMAQAQEAEEGINKLFFSEVDFLMNLIRDDLEESVLSGEIPTRLAITGVAMYGLSPVERAYFEESINQIFWENIAFNFQRVKEAFQLTLRRENGKIKVFRGATQNSDYLKYARSVGAEHYVDIFIYKLENVTSFEMYIHDATSNEVIWKKKWYIKRGGGDFAYHLGWKASIRELTTNLQRYTIANYLSNMFGIRLIGLGEVGVLVEPGIIYRYYRLFEQYDITFSFGLGPRFALNIFELANLAVLHFDFWIMVSTLAIIDIPVQIVEESNLANLYVPTFLFSPNVGFVFGLKESNFIAELGLDVFNIAPYFTVGFKL